MELIPKEMHGEIISHLGTIDTFNLKHINKYFNCIISKPNDTLRLIELLIAMLNNINSYYKKYLREYICWNRPKRKTTFALNIGVLKITLPRRFPIKYRWRGFFILGRYRHHVLMSMETTHFIGKTYIRPDIKYDDGIIIINYVPWRN
jgi:hypothetical protein